METSGKKNVLMGWAAVTQKVALPTLPMLLMTLRPKMIWKNWNKIELWNGDKESNISKLTYP